MKRTLFFILIIFFLTPFIVYSKTITIEVVGVAINVPGDFGKQYFYLTDGKNLWQAYNYYSKFPKIKKGDILTIRGEKSETRGINRIKIKEESQIKIKGETPMPAIIEVKDEDISPYLGKIVKISGEVRVDNESYYLFRNTKDKIILISPKPSNSFIKEAKNISIYGVPILVKNTNALLILNFEKISENQTKGSEKQTEIKTDLLRPKKSYQLSKIFLIIVIIFMILLLIFKIFKKKKNFDVL